MNRTKFCICKPKKYSIIIVCILICFGLSSCSSKKSYPLLAVADYSQSLKDYYDSDSLQKIEQSFFEIKLTKLYAINKDNITFYFYELLQAPKLKYEYSKISIEVTPDYGVNPQLKNFFEDKSGIAWKIYDVRPSTILSGLKNISYDGQVGNEYGSLVLQAYLVDGGTTELNAFGLSTEIAQKAIEQMIITIKMGSIKEVFHFSVHGSTKVLDSASVIEAAGKYSPLQTFVNSGLTVSLTKYEGKSK